MMLFGVCDGVWVGCRQGDFMHDSEQVQWQMLLQSHEKAH